MTKSKSVLPQAHAQQQTRANKDERSLPTRRYGSVLNALGTLSKIPIDKGCDGGGIGFIILSIVQGKGTTIGIQQIRQGGGEEGNPFFVRTIVVDTVVVAVSRKWIFDNVSGGNGRYHGLPKDVRQGHEKDSVLEGRIVNDDIGRHP